MVVVLLFGLVCSWLCVCVWCVLLGCGACFNSVVIGIYLYGFFVVLIGVVFCVVCGLDVCCYCLLV